MDSTIYQTLKYIIKYNARLDKYISITKHYKQTYWTFEQAQGM